MIEKGKAKNTAKSGKGQAADGALQGLAGLLGAEQYVAVEEYLAAGEYAAQSKLAGKELFDLVMQDRATPDVLSRTAINQAALFGLMLLAMDHQTEVMVRVSQLRSANQKSTRALTEREQVFDWCTGNSESAWRSLVYAVPKAMAATGLNANTSVRDAIRAWRKACPKK